MDTLDRSYEPMDVDVSGSSLNRSISSIIKLETLELKDNSPILIECGRTADVKEENVENTRLVPVFRPAKRLHVNLKLKAKKTKKLNTEKPKKKTATMKSALCALLALFLSLFLYNYVKVQCADELDTQVIKDVLFKKVFGQKLPTQDIVDALEDSAPQKIVVLYGSTGVGKTYTISLMLDSLWKYANVYHYTMPSFKVVFPHCLMTGLIICPWSIFVIDGLSVNDLNIATHIQEIVNKSVYLDKKLTLFLLYNCDIVNDSKTECDNSFSNDLERTYKDINAKKYYIKFNKLTKDNLISCITNELEVLDYTGGVNMNNILNNFDVNLNGCKSVHRKIKSLVQSL